MNTMQKFAWKFLTEKSTKTENISFSYDVNDHAYSKSNSITIGTD